MIKPYESVMPIVTNASLTQKASKIKQKGIYNLKKLSNLKSNKIKKYSL